MSTEYKLLVRGERSVLLEEHSNKLNLTAEINGDGNGSIPILRDLSPSEVARIAFKMLCVASYWMSDDDMKITLTAVRCENGPGIIDVIKALVKT